MLLHRGAAAKLPAYFARDRARIAAEIIHCEAIKMSQWCRSTFALTAILALELGLVQCARPHNRQAASGRARAQPMTAAQRRAAQQRMANRNAGATADPGEPPRQLPDSRLRCPQKPTAETKAEFQKLIGANWIWSPAYAKDEVPVGDCYFRKTFMAGGEVEFAQVHVACDNQYELYVNGQPAGNGADWRKMDVHDVTKLLRPGINVVAIKATNTDAGAAGLVARVIVKQKGGTFESFSTDDYLAHERQGIRQLECSPSSATATWLRGQGLRPARRRAAVGRRSRDRERRLAVPDRSGVRRRAAGHRRAGRLADRDDIQRPRRHPGFAGRRAAAA